jgi:hypothetical protein
VGLNVIAMRDENGVPALRGMSLEAGVGVGIPVSASLEETITAPTSEIAPLLDVISAINESFHIFGN